MQEQLPPKHRPTPPIPRQLGFLFRPWWLPFLLFWMLVFVLAYVAKLLGTLT